MSIKVDVQPPSGMDTVSTRWAWKGAQQIKNVSSTATAIQSSHHKQNMQLQKSKQKQVGLCHKHVFGCFYCAITYRAWFSRLTKRKIILPISWHRIKDQFSLSNIGCGSIRFQLKFRLKVCTIRLPGIFPLAWAATPMRHQSLSNLLFPLTSSGNFYNVPNKLQ